MQLDEFVKSSLAQIVSGVIEAQKLAKESGAAINPSLRNGAGRALQHNGAVLQDVEFDVAVTISESEKSGAGLRVGVPWMGGTVSGGSDAHNSQASRIKFVVSLALPVQPA